MFEISAILLRAGPGRADSVWKFLRAGPGRLGRKFLRAGPGRADLVQKFLRAGPTWAGPTWAENSSGPGRAGPIPKKQVWRKMTPKLVKNTLNWLQNPPKLGKGPWS